MTATVTVSTGAHAAEVRTHPNPPDGATWSDPVRVEPNSKQDFAAHSGLDVCVREVAEGD